MTVVHPVAATGFNRGATAYERGRPSYPASAVEWLIDRTGLTERSLVVDLAAGTGKLTRLLMPTGARVIAVEPAEGMARVLRRQTAGAEVLQAAAEAIPLPSGRADVVTVAQALHWFDLPRALSEIHRILGFEGWLALVWNRRLLEAPIHQAIAAIIDPHRGSTPSHHKDETWRPALEASPLFQLVDQRSFPHTQPLDEDGLVDRVLSTSFIAALPQQERGRVEQAIRDLARHADDHVNLPYSTDVHVLQRRGEPT